MARPSPCGTGLVLSCVLSYGPRKWAEASCINKVVACTFGDGSCPSRGVHSQQPAKQVRGSKTFTSAGVKWYIDIIRLVINLATMAAQPDWKTTPCRTLCRDQGVLSAEYTLGEIRLRYALRLRTFDKQHPLVSRLDVPEPEAVRPAPP